MFRHRTSVRALPEWRLPRPRVEAGCAHYPHLVYGPVARRRRHRSNARFLCRWPRPVARDATGWLPRRGRLARYLPPPASHSGMLPPSTVPQCGQGRCSCRREAPAPRIPPGTRDAIPAGQCRSSGAMRTPASPTRTSRCCWARRIRSTGATRRKPGQPVRNRSRRASMGDPSSRERESSLCVPELCRRRQCRQHRRRCAGECFRSPVASGRVGAGAVAIDGAPNDLRNAYCCTYLWSSARTVSATKTSPFGVSVM